MPAQFWEIIFKLIRIYLHNLSLLHTQKYRNANHNFLITRITITAFELAAFHY